VTSADPGIGSNDRRPGCSKCRVPLYRPMPRNLPGKAREEVQAMPLNSPGNVREDSQRRNRIYLQTYLPAPPEGCTELPYAVSWRQVWHAHANSFSVGFLMKTQQDRPALVRKHSP
jgi:hypothetical protein